MNEPPTGLLYIDLGHATFGLMVVKGYVVDAPPIAAYARGWEAGRAVQYFENRGATVKGFRDPPEPQ